MICKLCQRVYEANARFCVFCGQPLVNRLGDQRTQIKQEADIPHANPFASGGLEARKVSTPSGNSSSSIAWFLIAVGITIALIWGAKTLTAYATIVQAERSPATTIARSVDTVANVAGLPRIGSIFDPTQQAVYLQAKQEITLDLILVVAAFFIIIFGIVIVTGKQTSQKN